MLSKQHLFSTVTRLRPRLATTTKRVFSTIKTEETIPDQLEDHKKYLLNVYTRPSILFTHGKGCYLYDSTGRRYLDFTAGIAVNALGHADEGVAEVVAQQARELVHISNLFHHPYTGHLARLLIEASNAERPGSFGKVFFTNSGTEANEGALKLARKWGKMVAGEEKTGIVAFTNGFHGRSMGALSVTATVKYRQPFEPLIPHIRHETFDDVNAIKAITKDTCGVIVEPIQGEGGVNIASEAFLQALRKRCDEVNALLIYDEIQCGLGRTGKFWAHHHYAKECVPDVLTTAKPLANGIPIGAMLASDRVADALGPGDHGTTFGGAPLPTRVGVHVVERIRASTFLDHVARIGNQLRAQLEEVCVAFPELVAEVRGVGLLIGVEFRQDPTEFINLCRERGLLLVGAGRQTVRVIPPLIINDEEIVQGVRVWKEALEVLEKRRVDGLNP